MCGGFVIMINEDIKFMKLALKEAQKAASLDEVPVGAVIVKNGKVIARGHNLRETKLDPTMHAEIVAIRKACKKNQSWRLENTTLYVTIEPCAMCAGTILWARIDRVVFGARDPKSGALGSVFNLYDYKELNHHPSISKGILENECSQLMSNFFKAKRLSKKEIT